MPWAQLCAREIADKERTNLAVRSKAKRLARKRHKSRTGRKIRQKRRKEIEQDPEAFTPMTEKEYQRYYELTGGPQKQVRWKREALELRDEMKRAKQRLDDASKAKTK